MRSLLASTCLLVVACGDGSPDTGPTLEPPLDLRVEVSKEKVKLLEPIDIRLYLYRDRDLKAKAGAEPKTGAKVAAGTQAEVVFTPTVPEGFAGHIRRHGRRKTATGEILEYRGRLRPLRLGELTIPAYTVEAGEHRASSGEILIQVGSILGENADLAAIEAPAPLFPPRVHYGAWLLGAAGLVLLGLVVAWYLRRPRKVYMPRELPLQPHVKALRALARLKGVPRETEVQVEAFYVEVSQVLRLYLEERFGLHAPERTTEEFLAEIEQGDTLTGEQRRSLGQFLEQCDLVKFARLIPDHRVHDQTFQIAEAFVEQTRPDRVPGAAVAQGGAA